MDTYNKKENLLRMLNGEKHEHIPISFFQHLPVEMIQKGEDILFHEQFFDQTDFDFIKIMHDGLSAPISLELRSLDELRAYRSSLGENTYVQAYLERAKRVNERLNDRVYTYCNVFSPFTLLRRIGDERLLAFYREDAQAVKDALNRMGEDLAFLCEKLLTEAGCLGIFLAFQGAESGLFEPEEYQSLIAGSDKIVLDACNECSPYTILHFCGWNQIKNQLQLWKEYPGNTVNWATYVEELSLIEGRKFFGNKNCFGGFDNRREKLLYAGSKEAVEAETYRLLDEYRAAFGNTDTLMIGGDCSYLTDFDTKRFSWVKEAVRSWEIKNQEEELHGKHSKLGE